MASQKKSKNAGSSSRSGFGGYLRGLRAQRELTLREVAAAVGMDQAHLSKAELGRRLPTPAQANALARFFREDLVEFEGHCIAEKFRRRHAGSAAALHAIRLLHREQETGTTSVKAKGRFSEKIVRPTAAQPAPVRPPTAPAPVEESAPEENSGVIVLHVD